MTRRGGIALAPAIRRAIVTHARRERPRECCGLLVGRGDTVHHVVPMQNVEDNPARYRIDERAHLDLRRALRAFVPALSIVGVYHSHPVGPADPSPSDLAEAFYPEWIYLIVGLRTGRGILRAYRIQNGRAQLVRIRN